VNLQEFVASSKRKKKLIIISFLRSYVIIMFETLFILVIL